MGTGNTIRRSGAAAGRADDRSDPPRSRRRARGRSGSGRADPTRPAAIVAAFGAPGSGKSYFVAQLLKRSNPRRLLVVDPDNDYEGWGPWISDPVAVVRLMCSSSYRIRFRPSPVRARAELQFSFLCELAHWQMDPPPTWHRPVEVGGVTFVVDELAEFTGPSFRDAPPFWQWLVKRGRKYGATVIAASQRPEEIDKGLFSLASVLRVGRVGDPAGQLRLARALGVPVDRVRQLAGTQFIARDRDSGQLIDGGKA